MNDEELRGVTREILSAFTHADQAEEWANLLKVQRRQIGYLAQIIKGFSDLYLELTDKTADRQFLERIALRAEREAARTRLPLWFWRPEIGVDFREQMKRRVEYLVEEKYVADDVWDLCAEYVKDWAPPAERGEYPALLQGIIAEVRHADAG